MSRKISNCGILTYDLSDQLPTFCTLSLRHDKRQEKKVIRDMRNYNKKKFLNDVNVVVQNINNLILSKNDFNSEELLTNY